MDHHPRTIKELVAEAHNYEYSTSVPLKIYLRTAEILSRHADLYKAQNSNSDAYILYLRFLDLLTNKISKNPQLKKGTDQYKTYLDLLSNKAPSAFQNAEKIKKQLDQEIKAYEKYLRLRQEQQQHQKPKVEEKPVVIEPENIISEKDDFDEAKFASKLKQFQSLQRDSSPAPSYPKLEHSVTPIHPRASLETQHNFIPPSLPPKVSIQSEPPSLPPKTTLEQPQHKSIASTESKKPLKTVFLPSKLPLDFLSIASSNSQKNLETCGILCGSLSLNAFFITTLLIPSQESTSNTCQTLKEEDIFEYVDSHNLFVLGWIHTHPTQSCFLSSVDLHTQNSYQIMLPEALAIVCAVKHGVMGQFRLTDPPGVGIITRCQKSGFHPHEEKEIYRHCESKYGGHVVVKDGLPFDIVDLRK